MKSFYLLKTLALTIGLVLVVSIVNATTYYSWTNAAPEAFASWWTATNGTGTHPANFTTAVDVFIIQNSNTMTTANNWTVTGTVQINASCTLSVTSSNTTLTVGSLTINSGGTLTCSRPFIVNGATGGTNITGTINLSGTNRASSFVDLTLNGGAVWINTATGSSTVSISGNFTNNASTFTASAMPYNFTGATKTISGTSVIPTATFTGAYTNSGTLTCLTLLTITGVILTNTGTINSATSLTGNGTLSNTSGTVNITGGSCSITTNTNAATFAISGNATSTTALANVTNTGTINISGSGTITGITNSTGGTVNHSGSSTITSFNNATATSTLNISTTPTVPTFTALTIGTAGNTVNYSGAGPQAVKVVAYSNLTLSGSGAKTGLLTSVTKDFTLNGGASYTTTAALTIGGNLSVGNGTTFTADAFALTVSGTTTVGAGASGILAISSATGTKTFTGDVTLNAGSTWNETAAAVINFAGSLVNNATTFTSSTGLHTFSGNTKTIGGATLTSIASTTISGAYTSSGTITVNTALIVSGTLIQGLASTLNIGGTSTISVLDASTYANTVNYTLAGAQTITAVNYSSLGISGGSSNIKTINSGIIVSGTLTIATSTTLAFGTTAMALTLSGTGTNTLANSGTINMSSGPNAAHTLKIAATSNTSLGTITTGTGSSIEYTTLTGGQAINSFSYNNLKSDNTSGTNTAAGNLTIAGTLTTTAGGTLNMVANLLSAVAITNGGTIQTQNTSSTPVPTGKTWDGTVQYNASTGGQTVMAGTYLNLTFSNTSLAQTASGVIQVNGALTTTSGGIFNLVTYQLTGSLNTITNGGTIQTQNTSTSPIPSGKIWGGTVQYNASAGGQTVMTGTYNVLTLSNTGGTQTASGAITATTLNTTAGGTFNMVTYALSGITSVTNSGIIRTQNISATPLTTGLTWGGTVQYDATTGAQTVMSGTYATLTLSNTSGTQTASGNLTVNTALTTTSGGILNISNYQLLGTLSTITNGGTIQTQNASSAPITTGKTWGGTVQYTTAAGGQTVMAGTYNILTLSNTSGTQTASGAIAATTLNTTAGGTLNMVTYALSGLTSIVNSGTVRTQNTTSTPFTSGLTWGGTVIFDASTGQTSPASVFNNLTISDAAGVTAAANLTVSGILSLTANPNSTTGSLNMSSYTLEMGLTGTTTGVGDITGIVKRTGAFIGNIQYSFGNQYTTVVFINTGTKPAWLSCKIVLGSALTHKSNSVLRNYSFATDALTYTDKVVLNLHYLDAELQANTEPELVLWDDDVTPGEHGKSNHDVTNNWVGVTGLPINYVAPSITQPASTLWGLANAVATKNTWSGASSTEWNNTANWTGGIVPITSSDVLIPAGMPRYPSLTASSNAVAKTIEIQAGASLSANGYNIDISGFTGAFHNDGTFSATDGTVTFSHGSITDVVSISGTGTTNFYNLGISANTYLEPASNVTIGIAGAITTGSGYIFDLTATPNTVNYNGGSQTLIDPIGPGTDKGYYHLILGAGAKTFPSALTITGDFTNNGIVTATGSTVTLNGVGHTQNIGGSGTTDFDGLSIANTTAAVTTTANITVSGILTINANGVFTPGAANTIGGAGTLTGSGTAKVSRTAGTPDFNNQYSISTKTLTNLTIDYAGAGDQTVNPLNYGNLAISSNGSRTVTLASSGTIGVSAVFSPDLTTTNYTITGSTFEANGTGSQNVPAFNFNNVIISGVRTGGSVITLVNGGTIGIAGYGTVSATNTSYVLTNNTIDINGAGAQNLDAFTFNNLIISNSGTKTALGNLAVNGVFTVGPTVTLDMAGFALSGTMSSVNNSGTIKTANTSSTPLPLNKTWGASSGTVEYNGVSAQTVVAGIYTNLTMSGAYGGSTGGDITVNGLLSLATNPSAIKGIIETGSYILNMGVSSIISGPGDVTGTVKREHVFAGNTPYSFGSHNTSLTFLNTGSKPGWVSCKIAIGAAASWRAGAVKRYYSFAKDAGDDRVSLKLHYLDAEIQAETDESKFVLWDAIYSGGPWIDVEPQGKTLYDATNNWVTLDNMSIAYVAPSSILNDKQWGLAYTDVTSITWTGLGAFAGDWSLPGNWHGGVPTSADDVIIPVSAPYFPYRNLLSATVPAVAKTININTGASITSDGYDITVSGATNAWVNNGAFTPGTGTVIFNNGNTSNTVTLTGNTDFNNLTVSANTKIQPASGSINRISGSLTAGSGSILDFTTNANTLEYNGSSSQTILNPATGYSTLIFSGSGSKTVPTLSILGDFTNNGSFSATGSTITMAGSSAQLINGSNSSTFNNLTLNNASGAVLGALATVNGTLALSSGIITTGTNTLTVGSSGSISGASSSKYIDGKLALVYSGTGSKVFAIGKGGNFRPVTLTYSALTGTSTVTAEQFESALPGTLPSKTSLFSNRYWTLTQSGGSGFTYNITLDPTGFSPTKTPVMLTNNSGVAITHAVTAPNYTNTTGFTSFSDFALGQTYTSLTWTGLSSNDWGTASNWDMNIVPSGDLDADIPGVVNAPVVNETVVSPAICNNLTIESSAVLTVGAGSALTVNGTLANNATASGLVIKSNASGSGSLIHSTAGVAGTVERYIAGWGSVNQATHGWHFLSSPVDAQAISAFHDINSGNDFYKWDEITNMWLNRKAGGGFETNFAVGTGYLIANGTATTPAFTGILNVDDVPITGLTMTGTQAHTGWHLVGNPFSSALLWNNGSWNLSNISANCEIWDEASASYAPALITPGNVIPAMNGFMVHADAAGASFTIPASARVQSSQAWYKSAQENSDIIVLIARDPAGQTAQRSVIRFADDATEGYDTQYDNYFLPGFAPMFYSKSLDENYILNTLPVSSKTATIPMGFVKNGGSQFTIELSQSIPYLSVYLTDKKTGLVQKLNDGSYTFTSITGDNADRFLLNFVDATSVPDPQKAKDFNLYVSDGILNIQSLQQQGGKVAIIDMTGRTVATGRVEAGATTQINMQGHTGVYIVSVFSGKGIINTKVLVKQ